MARVITVTSGKGGVGKTNISLNLALCLASRGYRTCLFDADMGLANVDILLGIYPEYDLADVILGQMSIRDIIIRDYNGIDIIPGSSGVAKIADLEAGQIDRLIRSFSEIDLYDFIIFDTSAGISKNVVSFCMTSPEIILIVTPEPTSLTDAYALLKILSLNGFNGSIMVAINQSKEVQLARVVYAKFKGTVQKFLPINLIPLGVVIQDPIVPRAVKRQRPFFLLNPDSIASKCIINMAKHLIEKRLDHRETYTLEMFWTKCMEVVKSPLRLTGAKAKTGSRKTESVMPEKDRIISKDPAGQKPLSAVQTDKASSEKEVVHADAGTESYPAQEISASLDHLAKSVSSISQDIGAIRRLIENGRGMDPEAQEPYDDRVTREATIIPLDFDAFLEKRKMN